MKVRKRIRSVLLCMLAALLLPVQAWAAGSIELSRAVNLTVSYTDGDTPLSGAQFDLYFVASVDEYGALTPTAAFSQFNVDIRGKNDEAWKVLASTLEGFVLRDSVAPTDSGMSGPEGTVSFPNQADALEQGLYLVLGRRHTQGGLIYDAAPFMVLLPGLDKENNAWAYDVTVNPKHDSRPEPVDDTITRKVLKVWEDKGHETERPEEVIVQLLRDGAVYDTVTLSAANNWRHTWTGLEDRYQWTMVEKELEDYTVGITREGVTFVVTNTYTGQSDHPNPPGTPDSRLPQTGQLWWPVPVLIAGGLLLLVIGLLRRRESGYET